MRVYPPVADYMSRDVVALAPRTPLHEVARVFAETKVRGAPVVDARGEILGVVSQTDLGRAGDRHDTLAERGHFFTDVEDYLEIGELPASTRDLPVDDVMTREIVSIGSRESVRAAAERMRKRRVHRLLVVDGGELVGVVTALDLLGAM